MLTSALVTNVSVVCSGLIPSRSRIVELAREQYVEVNCVGIHLF